MLRDIIISEKRKRETCQKVDRTVNGNSGPACPVISVDFKDSIVPEASAFPCQ